MVNTVESGKALGLKDKLAFGKYRGELLETVVKGDPSYVRFLIGSSKPLQVLPEVLEYLK